MSWRPATLRGKRVLARCGEDGKLAVRDGRVDIRYRLHAGRTYRAAVRNLVLLEHEPILSDPADSQGELFGELSGPSQPVASPEASGADSPLRESPKAASGGARVRPPPLATDRSPECALVAYTDGACRGNPGPAGMGVVLQDGAERFELSRYLGQATNNIAELTAIGVAAQAVTDPSRPLVIYTDSRYSIGVLTQGWKAKANRDLIAEVRRELQRLRQCELIYVPGHAGHPGNERADELARQAIRDRMSTGWKKARRG